MLQRLAVIGVLSASLVGISSVPAEAATTEAVPAGSVQTQDTSPVQIVVREDGGQLVPLTDPKKLGEDDWVRLEYPKRRPRRPTMELQMESSVPEANEKGVATLLSTALLGTNRVRLLDPNHRKSGTGTKYVLSVCITDYEMKKKGHGLGALGGGFLSQATGGVINGARIGNQRAEVGLTVRLLSNSTGEVLKSMEVKGKTSSLSLGITTQDVPGLGQLDLDSWSTSSFSAAARIAAAKVAFKVFEWLESIEPLK